MCFSISLTLIIFIMEQTKLNELEMSKIVGGSVEVESVGAEDGICKVTCTCIVGHTEARDAYKHNLLVWERDYGA